MHLHQVDTQGLPCCAADVSLSGQFLAFGDSGGYIHNWSNSTASNDEDIVLNPYSHPTVFPDQVWYCMGEKVQGMKKLQNTVFM